MPGGEVENPHGRIDMFTGVYSSSGGGKLRFFCSGAGAQKKVHKLKAAA